jgi:thiol-disulfide isomerase/thioredoxin
MKKLFFALLYLIGSLPGYCQQGYTVRVRLDNPDKYPILIVYAYGDKFVRDTSSVEEDGWLVFKGKVTGAVMASLIVRKAPASIIKLDRGYIPGPALKFFLTNEPISIVGQVDIAYMAKVKGGTANDEWAAIRPGEDSLTHESWIALKNAYEHFKSGDDSAIFTRVDVLRENNERKDELLRRQFMEKNPGSLASMYFLSEMLNSLSLEELKAAYANQGGGFKGSVFAKSIDEKIRGLEATAIGKAAIPIDKNDADGKPVNLQTLKGKYVLIDFWGSWCGPCRGSHPYLRQLYGKYKDKGLEIVGIALEQSEDLKRARETWLKAVKEDKLSWIQVLNNEGIKKFDAVKAYGITAFPTKILLDKDGRIIARLVGEEEGPITEKLKQVFGE